MRCIVIQFARESVGLCPFRGSYVREFELSHSIKSSKQDFKNNSFAQFAREDVGLCPFYNSYVNKRNLFTRKVAH